MRRSMAATMLLLELQIASAWVQHLPAAVRSPTAKQLWTLNGRYSDARHGVTFRYPEVWKATTNFGMHEPALTTTDLLTPTAGFGYGVNSNTPANMPYGQTTTEGFGVVYTADAGACAALGATLAKSSLHETVMIHGRTYTTRGTSDAGMSQSISGTLYTTYADTTCCLFEVDEANMASGVNEDERVSTPEESRLLASGLRRVMGTVRIHPHR